MNENLKKAVVRDKRKQQEISPISQSDAEIMEELFCLFDKLAQKSITIQKIKDVMEYYKVDSDANIVEKLMGINLETAEDAEEVQIYKKMITVGTHILEVRNIVQITSKSVYNSQKSKLDYLLIINENVSSHCEYPDTQIVYGDSFSRNYDLEMLKRNLSNQGVLFLD